VNDDTGRADQFQQYVRVDPQGQVHVAYFDRRHDPDNFFIDSYWSRSDDGGQTFRDVRVSHEMWDPTINPPISGSGEFIGDYQGLVSDECRSVWFANDTHLANDAGREAGAYDIGKPRSQFQQVHAWRLPNPNAPDSAKCREEAAGLGEIGGRFVISRRAVKLTRGGRVRVRVSCRTPLGCSGRLRIATARRVRTGRSRRGRIVTLGSTRYNIGTRRRGTVLTVRLSRAERRLIARLRRTPINASATVTVGDPPLRGRVGARFRLHRARR
jgi:hypothetical protein